TKLVKRAFNLPLVTLRLISMIALSKYVLVLTGFFVLGIAAGGQTSISITAPLKENNCKPPKSRELFHDYIDDRQQSILRSDGRNDNLFTPSPNDEINFLLTRSLLQNVDAMQCSIEKDSTLKDQAKVKYLRGIDYLLRFFQTNTSSKKVSPVILPDIINAYEKCMQYDKRGQSIEGIIKNLSYESGYSVINADNSTFERNAGYKASQDAVVLKYCKLHPDKIFATLNLNPNVLFADSLVRAVAQQYPKQLYDHAQANNKFGSIIRNINDDKFIRTVVKMARNKDGQQYFCFLDNIVNGKLTFEEIDAAKPDSVLYYRLLVKTRMDYAKRMINKDTAFEVKTLTDRLERKARENFVNIINGLHDERNLDVRFRNIQSLTAEELYYLAVSTDGSIYTSSFVKGTYPLMMKKINNRGDSLLQSLNFDRYRKFIKMCAGFNTLDDFLSTFPPKKSPGDESDAEKLMRAFVSRLEIGNGLEDGVDVADSYASIAETMKPLAAEILKNIQVNYKRNESAGNKRGIAIYNILNKLFLSADTTQKIDLTKELGIPPVYEVPFKDLDNDSGQVAVQLFIYGDKDGIGVFPGLISMFNNSNWKIDGSNKQWVTITAAKGKPVSLYMNRPLPEETNEDAKAQAALCEYLATKNIIPTVTINRGHSYNAPYTIDQMSTASKIVFMGSCGGYRMIHDILEKAPDAHIIGTKQIADAPVNNPFLKLIMEKLRIGSNIEWIPFWAELDKMVTDKIFDDYVPPHKNLGALFIKAYKKAMGE
ncbi:MAG TPA: hypothetical protein VMZ03_06745, partial [Chitinophagaceae bacterium]|nr:hypothetical protein [Chitinophagaceae bacterium]